MKGTFKAIWYQSKHIIYRGDPKDDTVELVIEIEEVTPETMKKLAESLGQFRVDWL